MKISISIQRSNPQHTTFRIFVNGGYSGELVLTTDEFEQFMAILQPDKIRDESDKFEITDRTNQLS